MSDSFFAQAQQRIIERRRAGEADARNRPSSVSPAQLSRHVAYPAELTWMAHFGGHASNLWDYFASREGTRPLFRVGQVDAELLDEELVGLLQGQVGHAVRYLGGLNGNVAEDWTDEVHLMLRAILFKLSVWDHCATYGAALQNLRFTNARQRDLLPRPPSKWQKLAYGFATVGAPYTWKKWEDWLSRQYDGVDTIDRRIQQFSSITSYISTAYSTAAFASFLVFLLSGRYRTLLDRVLRLRLAPPSAQMSRDVSFEYLNRQLVWHALTEFLLFFLPLIGINRWRRWLGRIWRNARKFASRGVAPENRDSKGELSFLPERTCGICWQEQNAHDSEQSMLLSTAAHTGGISGSALTDITNPYAAIPCGCVYCYVCLASRIEGEDGNGWTCLRCGELIKECQPWDGDVLTSTKRAMLGKSVAFEETDEMPP